MLPAGAPKFRRRKAERPDEIVSAALEVFVEKGFFSDGSSTPALFQGVLPVWGPHGHAVLLHDKLCKTGYCLEVNERGEVRRVKLTRKEIDNIGGSEHTVPAHATVIILGLISYLPQLTITTGTGLSIVPGLKVTFSTITIID